MVCLHCRGQTTLMASENRPSDVPPQRSSSTHPTSPTPRQDKENVVIEHGGIQPYAAPRIKRQPTHQVGTWQTGHKHSRDRPRSTQHDPRKGVRRHISSCEVHLVGGNPKIYINNPSKEFLRAVADFPTPEQRQGEWLRVTNISKDATPRPNDFKSKNRPGYDEDHRLLICEATKGLGIDAGERFLSPEPRLSKQPKRPDNEYIDASFFTQDRYDAYLPQSYRSVLHNRIRGYNLDPGGKWDVEVRPPIFVFDSLMLPSTVATTDPLRYYHKLTPALLPHHTLLPAKTTHQPLLLPTPSNPSSYARGCLLFGLDPTSRTEIYQHHYSMHPYLEDEAFQKVEVEVQTDIVVAVDEPHLVPRTRWRLRTVFVRARAMIFVGGVGGVEAGKGEWGLGKFVGRGFEGEERDKEHGDGKDGYWSVRREGSGGGPGARALMQPAVEDADDVETAVGGGMGKSGSIIAAGEDSGRNAWKQPTVEDDVETTVGWGMSKCASKQSTVRDDAEDAVGWGSSRSVSKQPVVEDDVQSGFDWSDSRAGSVVSGEGRVDGKHWAKQDQQEEQDGEKDGGWSGVDAGKQQGCEASLARFSGW